MDIELGHPDSARGEPVETGSRNRASIEPRMMAVHVVGEDHDNVGALLDLIALPVRRALGEGGRRSGRPLLGLRGLGLGRHLTGQSYACCCLQ